jgi:hypothetical protein
MILHDCEIWYPKLMPGRPNAKFDKKNPTWELQLRTTSKEKKKEWEALNLNVKAVIPDEDGADPFYRVNIKRKTIKADGTASKEVEVVDGNMDPVDPGSIGNGSIGNIRIFQYPYESDDGPGIASMLMAVQLTTHIVYKSAIDPDDQFGATETKVITPPPEEEETPETTQAAPSTPSTPAAPGTPSLNPPGTPSTPEAGSEIDDEIPF